MDRYQGNADDKMQGGGKHIEKYGWGGEMFNFKPSKGKMYGYCLLYTSDAADE